MSSLSVVMPVFNEAPDLAATIDALLAAVDDSGFESELVLVDDGSTDRSVEVVRTAAAGRIPIRVLKGANRGRFAARRTGVEAATGEFVLLLDGRVRIDPGALAYANAQIASGKRVWTADVHIDGEQPFARFWKLLAELAWSSYFDAPREASFGLEEFDRYPKGTTCFLAPRYMLLEAIAAFRSRYTDLRDANDDTPLLRWIAARENINISPEFTCRYRPRTSVAAFLRHSVHRGVVFLDGHGRLESRFFPVVAAFYPASAALSIATLRKPVVAPAVLAATSLAAATLGLVRRRSAAEVASLAVVTPLYGLAHGYGMWRGLATMLRRPPRGGARP